MTDRIKECPFCGGEAKLNSSSPYFVKCSKCFAKSGVASTPAFAVINWNTRKPMDRIVKALEVEMVEREKRIARCLSNPFLHNKVIQQNRYLDEIATYRDAIIIVEEGGREYEQDRNT